MNEKSESAEMTKTEASEAKASSTEASSTVAPVSELRETSASTEGETRKGNMKLAGVFVALGLIAGLTTSGTMALWSDQEDTSINVVTAGNLDIELEGETEWSNRERVIDPETYLMSNRDRIYVKQDFTVDLEGDNNLGTLTVSWENPPPIVEGVAPFYTISDSSGATLTEWPPVLGETVTIDLPETYSDTKTTFTMMFYIEVSMPPHYVDPNNREAAERRVMVDLDEITIELDQRRGDA